MQPRSLAARSACFGCGSFTALAVAVLLGGRVVDTHASSTDTQPAPASEPAKVPGPMAAFARMEAGEWRLGTVHTTTWRWGPRRHSIRAHRVGSDFDGNPWRELVVYYWCPHREQIRLMSFHPDIPGIGRGVGEGTIRFEGDTAASTLELHQPGVRRELAGRWTFDGPDTYRDVLLEDTGRGLATLAEWEYARSMQRTPPPSPATDGMPAPSRNIAAFVPLIGRWESGGDGDAERVHSHFEWMEYLDVVALRVEAASGTAGSEHMLDAYFYHHVAYDELRFLALPASGGVYEGVVTVLEDNSLELDVKRHEGDAGDRRLVRLDLAAGGSLRAREWSVDGDDRTLVLDATHRRSSKPHED